MKNKKNCCRNVGDCIEGDSIRIECQKPDKQWRLFQKSKQHRAMRCIVKKDAKATIIKSYKNLQK